MQGGARFHAGYAPDGAEMGERPEALSPGERIRAAPPARQRRAGEPSPDARGFPYPQRHAPGRRSPAHRHGYPVLRPSGFRTGQHVQRLLRLRHRRP